MKPNLCCYEKLPRYAKSKIVILKKKCECYVNQLNVACY